MIAITGSSGLVGGAVARAFEARGRRVRGTDRSAGARTSVIGDLRDPAVRLRALSGASVLVHAAARHAPHVGRVPDAEFRAVNVDATEALLDDAIRAGVRRVVYLSSTSVYGHALVPGDRAVWVDESLRPAPRDIYDETKLAAERLVAAAGIPAVVLRIARCFPEPPPVRAVHLLHRAVDLSDVVAAVVRAVERPVPGIYNIAGRYPFRRGDDVLHDAAAVIERRAPEIAAAFRERGWPLPRSLDRVYDSGAAARALGYRPAHDVLRELGRR